MIIKERIPRQGYTLIWTHDVPDDEEWRDSTGQLRFKHSIPEEDSWPEFLNNFAVKRPIRSNTKLSDLYKG